MTEIENLTFEEAMAQLQALVETMEKGDGTLEENLALYERGMKLVAYCNQLLEEADMRVQELLPNGDEIPFTGPMDSRS